MYLIVSFEVLLYVKICFINNVLSSEFSLTIIFEECWADTVSVKKKMNMYKMLNFNLGIFQLDGFIDNLVA